MAECEGGIYKSIKLIWFDCVHRLDDGQMEAISISLMLFKKQGIMIVDKHAPVCMYTGYPLLKLFHVKFVIILNFSKEYTGLYLRVYNKKNNFLVSQPKHMLWVLKRTVSLRQFF